MTPGVNAGDEIVGRSRIATVRYGDLLRFLAALIMRNVGFAVTDYGEVTACVLVSPEDYTALAKEGLVT